MRFDVITIFPEMITEPLKQGVVGQSIARGEIELTTLTPREFSKDMHKTVDDRPFGGGDGMVMLAEPLAYSVDKLKKENSKVIYLSARGGVLSDKKVRDLATCEHLILICGRYGGVDERFVNTYVDEEISIGDYVLSGGEFAALVLIDAVSRHLPNVLGNVESKEEDSFATGLLEYPQYTRPAEWRGIEVPQVLTNGNHAKIKEYRHGVSLVVTMQRRPDLFEKLTKKEKDMAQNFLIKLSAKEKEVLGIK